MKYSYFKLAVLSSLMFILSCCKDKDKAPDPVETAYINYTPIVSWTKTGQVPLIYEGDTIKYNITATASADITEINVYKVDIATGTKTLLSGYPKTSFADKRSITDQVYVPVGAKADFKSFYLSIETKEGTPVTTLATYKYTTLSELTVQTGLRLGFHGRSYDQIFNYKMSDTIQTDGACLLISDNLTRYKINGIRTDYTYDSFNKLIIQNYASYIKFGVETFDSFHSPDQIKSYYMLLKAQAKYILDVNTSDLALCKLYQNNDTINYLPTYGIIQISSIYDDGRQENDVNPNTDYLMYNIKVFNPYRFK